MIERSDYEYFCFRARAERQLSFESTDEVTAAIHNKLAERYERLMRQEATPRPLLRIVSS